MYCVAHWINCYTETTACNKSLNLRNKEYAVGYFSVAGYYLTPLLGWKWMQWKNARCKSITMAKISLYMI